MGYILEKEDSTNGKQIKTGDNIIVKATGEKGFVITIIDDEYMCSVNGKADYYTYDEIEWIDS